MGGGWHVALVFQWLSFTAIIGEERGVSCGPSLLVALIHCHHYSCIIEELRYRGVSL